MKDATIPAVDTATAEANAKRATLAACNRFITLQGLLPRRLMDVGTVIEVQPTLASPLSLLRGLGWSVGGFTTDPAEVVAVRETYGIEPGLVSSGAVAAVPACQLVLALGIRDFDAAVQGLIRQATDQLQAGGIAVFEVACSYPDWKKSGEVLASGFDVALRLLEALEAEGRFVVTRAKPVQEGYWFVAELKGARGSNSTAVGSARRSMAIWRRIERLAKGHRLLGAANGAAWRAWANPTPVPVATYRVKTAIKRVQINRANAAVRKHVERPVVHFGLHASPNAGDVVLFETVRSALGQPFENQWLLEGLHKPVTEAMVTELNRSRGLVIGGGGLFLVDSNPNSVSGWQWPCKTELLRKIEAPIAVFAVGYNRFRGQGEFPEVFVESLNTIVEKSAFFGLRNHGSIKALKSYLPESLHSKLVYQPCATTVLSYLDMPRAPSRFKKNPGERVLVLNVAFDRHGLRFRGREQEMLGGVAQMARQAKANGWRVVYASHLPQDEAFLPFLDKAGVVYETIQFTGVPTAQVLSFYESVDLVVGMRGHAQMIPFGLGTPIISLVAHDKMQWFLDDVGHSDWGVEFNKPDVGGRLLEVLLKAEKRLPEMRGEVAAARDRLWGITKANIDSITSAFSR